MQNDKVYDVVDLKQMRTFSLMGVLCFVVVFLVIFYKIACCNQFISSAHIIYYFVGLVMLFLAIIAGFIRKKAPKVSPCFVVIPSLVSIIISIAMIYVLG